MGHREQLADFGAFYERTYPAALRVAFGIVGERATADDVTQDAYATAYRERDRYRGDGPPEAWLYRIVVNTALGVLRHQRVRWIVPLDPETHEPSAGWSAGAPASAVLVKGTETCDVAPGPLSSPDPDGTSHGRGGTLRCTDEANDPRVSGAVSGTFEADVWGPDTHAFVEWGTLRLENEEGAWEGRYTGVNTTETGDMFEVWYRGTGGYAGLSYFQWVTPSCDPIEDVLEFTGLIFPGLPPAP